MTFAEEFNVTEQWVCITIIMTSCALWPPTPQIYM